MIKRFAWALVASLLLHLGLLFMPPLNLPPPADAPPPIIARLEPVPLAPPKPPAKPLAKQRKRPPRKLVAAAKPRPAAPAAMPLADASAAKPPEPAAAPQAPPPAEPPFDPGRFLPVQARLDYQLNKGAGGLVVGQSVHTLEIKDGHYALTSVTEASGIFSLFKSGKLVQISQGDVTPEGLRPASFWAQRGQSAETTDAARFDWANRVLSIESSSGNRSAALVPGTQDLLSFLYQFAFHPPHPGEAVSLAITNGRKLDNYVYDAAGIENIDLPSGSLNALRLVKRHAPNEEWTEIWLAVDNRYLPVKIRQNDRNGVVAEQVLRAVSIKPPKDKQ